MIAINMKHLIVYECIVELEIKKGIPVKRSDILRNIIEKNHYKIKISKEEANKIIEHLTVTGAIFIPRKDYVARFVSWKTKYIQENLKVTK